MSTHDGTPREPAILTRDLQLVPVAQLREHPENPRDGDEDGVAESIRANGFYGALIVQRSTGYILAGNHRARAAIHLGARALPVIYVDVTDEHALKILLADNRTGDRGSYHDVLLLAALERVDDLHGTGYDDDDVEKLRKHMRGESDQRETDATDADADGADKGTGSGEGASATDNATKQWTITAPAASSREVRSVLQMLTDLLGERVVIREG